MKEFLYRQFEIIECVEHKLAKSSTSHKITKPILSKQNSHQSCKLCKRNHSLKHCKQFKKLPISQRYKFIKTNNICTNCLALHHTLKRCTSRHRCLHCQKMHNTLLHISPTHGFDRRNKRNVPLTSPCQDKHKQVHLTTPSQDMQKNAILTSPSQNIQKTVMITPDHNSQSVNRNNMQSHYSSHEKICSLHTLIPLDQAFHKDALQISSTSPVEQAPIGSMTHIHVCIFKILASKTLSKSTFRCITLPTFSCQVMDNQIGSRLPIQREPAKAQKVNGTAAEVARRTTDGTNTAHGPQTPPTGLIQHFVQGGPVCLSAR
ncbi:unnamed protein product [Ceratitis capitata]|uniref:(Mediterranean fruit fly) hypothetical protein n=1 Tax=Ceratitis capitata TaxID=7213 RepID=A0A811UV42_CERCA|nr:unnamed protein product [Ceratitis capitata]